jgi:ketosteroid isomerase-like protein
MSVSAKAAPQNRDELVKRYMKAWGEHDLEGILSLHTSDYTEFIVHGGSGVQKWTGTDAVRDCFDFLLRAWPDQSFETTSLVVSDNLYVGHHNLTGTLVAPWPMGDKTYQPTGTPITFEIVDIMHCEGNLIRSKEGWIDGLAIAAQLQAE